MGRCWRPPVSNSGMLVKPDSVGISLADRTGSRSHDKTEDTPDIIGKASSVQLQGFKVRQRLKIFHVFHNASYFRVCHLTSRLPARPFLKLSQSAMISTNAAMINPATREGRMPPPLMAAASELLISVN